VTTAVALGALVAPGAAAHVTVAPSASRPADVQRYRVIVPNERSASATTGVDLQVPPGVTFALVESVAGWQARLVRRGGQILEIRWRGGRVPPGGYAELRFLARNPVRVGTIAWKSLQRYDDGTIARWIGSPGSEQPAPLTRLSEDVAPVDVVSTHGQPAVASAPGEVGAPAGTARGSDGRDGLTLAIALVAAVLGAAALGLQLMRRRQARPRARVE
jgi:uncharacterized protein YcnI